MANQVNTYMKNEKAVMNVSVLILMMLILLGFKRHTVQDSHQVSTNQNTIYKQSNY